MPPDLRDQLRSLIDAAADPISTEEVAAHPNTVDLEVVRQNSRRRRRAAAVLAGAAAAVLVVAAAGLVSLLGSDADDVEAGQSEPLREALVADFEWDYDPTQTAGTACSFGTTYFLDRSQGAPTSWLWEFPDGSTSSEQNPIVPSGQTVVFGEDGLPDRTVTLTVYRDGESYSTERFVSPTHC